MKRNLSVIKFMKKEELVDMLVQIKNFRNPNTGKHFKKYQTCQDHWTNPWNRAEYRFNLKNLDFVDVLICGEGYVRYYGGNEDVLDMMRKRFGFVDE